MTKKNFIFILIFSAFLALVFFNVVVFTEILHFRSMLWVIIVSSTIASFLGLIRFLYILIKSKYDKSIRIVIAYIIISIFVNILLLQGYLELFYKLFFNLGAGF